MEEKKKTVFADLGQKGYREVWELQERLLEKVKAEKAGNKIPENHLLFVEHDPVYTLGKSGNEANMLISAIQLRAKHAEFIKVDRGGDITFHGPGQLVVYPVIDLESFGLGVKDYVDRLEARSPLSVFRASVWREQPEYGSNRIPPGPVKFVPSV